MTHIFEVSTNQWNALCSGNQNFDILKLGRKVSVGDVVIYQRLADTENEENDDAMSGDEIAVEIVRLFDDEDGALKNGYTAFSFKEKIPSN
jgi:hypothetical protein